MWRNSWSPSTPPRHLGRTEYQAYSRNMLSSRLRGRLRAISNNSLRDGSIPTVWKSAEVCPLPNSSQHHPQPRNTSDLSDSHQCYRSALRGLSRNGWWTTVHAAYHRPTPVWLSIREFHSTCFGRTGSPLATGTRLTMKDGPSHRAGLRKGS